MNASRYGGLVFVAGLVAASAVLVGCAPGGAVPTPVASATSSGPSPTGSSTPTVTPDPVPPDVRENIIAAVSSGNTAALYDLWAATVHVTYAASEYEGDVSDRMLLVDNVTAVAPVTATWDFDLDASVLDEYRNHPGSAGAYVDDFPPGAIVGLSSEAKVISFVVSGGLITRLFIAEDESSLTF